MTGVSCSIFRCSFPSPFRFEAFYCMFGKKCGIVLPSRSTPPDRNLLAQRRTTILPNMSDIDLALCPHSSVSIAWTIIARARHPPWATRTIYHFRYLHLTLLVGSTSSYQYSFQPVYGGSDSPSLTDHDYYEYCEQYYSYSVTSLHLVYHYSVTTTLHPEPHIASPGLSPSTNGLGARVFHAYFTNAPNTAGQFLLPAGGVCRSYSSNTVRLWASAR